MGNQPSDAIDLDLLRAWMREAGRIALSSRAGADWCLKEDGSVLTAVDRKIAFFLQTQISQHYPAHRVLCEDGDYQGGESDYMWVIDPLDGSRAFAAGLPFWGISIGVLYRGQPFLGTVALPQLREIYWGGASGAHCNRRRLNPPTHMGLNHPLAALLVPSNAHRIYEIGFHRVRSLGSTVAHLGCVARGAALGAITRRVYLWDIAGFLPMLRDTGIALVYLSGRPLQVDRLLGGEPAPEALVAAPAHLVDDVRAMFQPRPGGSRTGTAGAGEHTRMLARES